MLVSFSGGNDAVNPVVCDAPVADIKGKSRTKSTGKAGSTGPKGRGKEEQQKQSKKALPTETPERNRGFIHLM